MFWGYASPVLNAFQCAGARCKRQNAQPAVCRLCSVAWSVARQPRIVPRCATRCGGRAGGKSVVIHQCPACVTFRRVAVPLRGPGQSPALPLACCVGLLRSDGRCGLCSLWCCFRVSVFAAHPPPHPGRPPASPRCHVRDAQLLHLCAWCTCPPPPPTHTSQDRKQYDEAIEFGEAILNNSKQPTVRKELQGHAPTTPSKCEIDLLAGWSLVRCVVA